MTESPGDLPCVALHKLGGWRAEWNRLAHHLVQPCLALDLPGHGICPQSDPPIVQAVEDSAAAVMATLDSMEVGRFDLVGTSLGGAVATYIASQYAERVRRLTLIGVALTPASSMEALEAADARAAALYLPDDRPRPRTGEEMERLFGVRDPAVQADMEAARLSAGRWIRPSWRGVSLADVEGWLPRITASTTLLYGDRGGYRQFEAVARARLPHISVGVIEDSGSFPHQEQPELTARFMRG